MADNNTIKLKLYTVALIYTFSIGFSFLAIKKMCTLCRFSDYTDLQI